MKKILFLALASAFFTYSCSPVKKVAQVPPVVVPTPAPVVNLINSQLDSVSYAFGASIGADLRTRGITSLEYSLVAKALKDVLTDSANVLISPQKSQEVIYNYLSVLEKKKFEVNINESTNFLAQNKAKAGITTLESGLQYEILKAGTGPKPTPSDEITVHYKGTLLNGKQFDSSYDRGEPATFVLSQVIPGWTEGLQLMPQGSKYRFYIPYSLAYGERGAGNDIPPYSTLIFEVELLKIGGK